MNLKKIVLRTVAGLLALSLGLAIVAVLLVKLSPPIRQKILARITRDIGANSGTPIEIRDFRLAPSRLGLELEGIVVGGSAPQSKPPLLEIERVTAEIEVGSLLQRQWSLRNLVIDHPVVHVSVDRSGENNLPKGTSDGRGGTPASIFNVAIQTCLVNNGEVYFNDAKSRLAAELHNVQLKAQFDSELRGYHGSLGYSQGKIQYADYLPAVHELKAEFTLAPTKLNVEKVAVVSGRSQIVARGEVQNFSRPSLRATYDAHLWTGDLPRTANKALPVEGVLEINGTLNYQRNGNRPFLHDVVVAGEVRSSLLQANTPTRRITVRGLNAAYRLAGGNFEIQDLRAWLLDGNLNGSLIVRDVAGTSHSRLKARLHNISLEQLETVAPQYSLPETHVRGRINASTEATWGRTLADLAAHGDVTLEGVLGENPSAALSGALHIDYRAARDEIELHRSYFHTPTTSLTMDGKVSRYSQLQVTARSSNLHELELLAANFKTGQTGQRAAKLELHGAGTFHGFITGMITEPLLQGRLEARDLRVKGSSWKLLQSSVDAGPSALKLSDGLLEDATHGTIKFNLRVGLMDWAYQPASPVKIEVLLSEIPLAHLEILAKRSYPISGNLSGNVSVHGSQVNPVGHGEISLAGGKIFSEPIQKLSLKFEGNGETVQARVLVNLLAGGGVVQTTLNPKTQEYQAQIRADNIRLERLQTVRQRNLSLVGALNVNAAGHGTLSSPELTATLKMSQLRFQEQTLRDLTLAVGVREHVAEITLTSEFAQTPLEGHGTIKIYAPYLADLHLDTPRFSLRPLLTLYAPAYDADVHGEAELHASLRGPLQNQELLEGHLEIPALTVGYEQFRLGAVKPIRLDYRDGLVQLQPTTLEGTDTKLQVEGSIAVHNPAAASYVVKGTVDLVIAQLLDPGLRGSGQIEVDLDSRRHAAGSDMIGELRLVHASLHGSEIPLGLDNGSGVVTVSPNRMEVKSFQGQVGGSTVTARGGINLRPSVRFDLGLSGKEIRLRYPTGVRSVLDSELTFAGNKQEATLAGNVIVQRLSLTPDFDIGGFIDQFSDEKDLLAPPGFTQHIRLDVQLQSASQLSAESTKISFRGSANLRLTGTAAEPVILGRADLNGGDLFLFGSRYTVQSAAIDFINPMETEPVVNAQVKTRIDQYDINLNIQGTMDRLQTTYTSEPPLPPVDIINLLAFGHTSQNTAGNPNAPANLGAQSALVQGLGSAVSSRVERFAGLSYFSIDPSLGGSNRDAGARVVIQERVTSNLVVTYSTDVTSTQRQAVQLEYRFNPRWSVSGVRDQNGGLGATANYHRTF